MDNEGRQGSPDNPRDRLESTLKQVAHLRRCIDEAIETIGQSVEDEASKGVSVTELSKKLAELRKMNSVALNEEQHLATELRKENGGLGPGAFDLEAARAEIGRRLAGLRTARSGGELPGGAE
jgi:hypothetical protein